MQSHCLVYLLIDSILNANVVVQELAEAYEILGNADKRAIFDDFGRDHQG